MQENNKEKKELSDIPIELIFIIVTGVQEECIPHCRLVCQSWKTMLTERWNERKPSLHPQVNILESASGLKMPMGVCVDTNEDKIYVADANNDLIKIFDYQGNILQQWKGISEDDKFKGAEAIALTTEGNVIIQTPTNIVF
jgi:hypothetical protein